MVSLTYYLAISALCAFIMYVILYNWRRRHLYWAASKIQGPPSLPIIGNAALFMCKNEDILMTIYNITKDSNLEPIKLWLGPMLLLVFLNPEHVEIFSGIHKKAYMYYDERLSHVMQTTGVAKILSSSKFAHKHDVYEFMKIYLGDGLVSGSGPQYKQHRRIIQPMFSLNFAKDSISVFQRHIDLCMENLGKYVDKGTFDIHSTVHKCMVDVTKESPTQRVQKVTMSLLDGNIFQTTESRDVKFGTNVHGITTSKLITAKKIILGSDERSQLNGLNEFDQAMLDVYDFGFTRMITPLLQPDIIFNMTSYKKRQDELQGILRQKAGTVIQDSIKRRKHPKSASEFYPIIDRIMDHVENNPGVISDKVLIDHMITLHTVTEDTFTIISSFLIMCLGMYPEYQEKAVQEIREIFGDTPRSVTEDDISKLNYVTMCMKEAIRLLPIAPVILRKCTEDFQLDKWFLPKGCAVVIPIFTVHRDERFWENPHHFHPDHFLPEFENKRHLFAYVPFSAGPRGCIGKNLSHTGLKVFICNLLQRFEIEADGKLPDVELRMDISARPKRGYPLRLKKRVWK